MAIYYCDIYNGNNSNNGQSGSTAKLTINAVTALVTSVNDEIRVRGYDNLYTEYTGGTIWWRNGSTSLTGSTNLGLVVGNFIYKSTDILPEIYKIASTGWTGSVYTVGLTLNTGNYEGTTEECYIRKINTPSGNTTVQDFNKAAYYSGTQGTWYSKTGNTISGGWDETYTNRTGYTLLYSTATTGTAWNQNKDNWDTSYIMVIGYSVAFNGFAYSNAHHMISSTNAGTALNVYPYLSFSNSVINCQTGADPAWKCGTSFHSGLTVRGGSLIWRSNGFGTDWEDCTFSNCSNGLNGLNGQSWFRRCKFLWSSYWHYDGINLPNFFSGCTFRNNTMTISGYYAVSNFYGCTFTTITAPPTSGNYFDSNLTAMGSGYGQGNYTITNRNINSVSATIGSTYLFTYRTNYCPTNTWNPENEEFNSNYNTFLQKDSLYNLYFYNTGSVQATGITYSGSTGLKVLQYSSTYSAIVGTVEFFISSGTTYNYSFYAKSSNASTTLNHRYYNMGQPIGAWSGTTINNSTWTQCTGSFSGQSNSGLVKLHLKFNIGTNGYVYANNFSITPMI